MPQILQIGQIFEAMDWLREARSSGMGTGVPHAWREFELTHRLGERFEMASLYLCQTLHQVLSTVIISYLSSTAFQYVHVLIHSLLKALGICIRIRCARPSRPSRRPPSPS